MHSHHGVQWSLVGMQMDRQHAPVGQARIHHDFGLARTPVLVTSIFFGIYIPTAGSFSGTDSYMRTIS